MSPDREPGDRAFWDTGEGPPEGTPATPAEGSAGESAIPRRPRRPQDNPLIEWARALALGVRDTAQDMLDEGRSGAKAKQSQMWEQFDRKTRGRRSRE